MRFQPRPNQDPRSQAVVRLASGRYPTLEQALQRQAPAFAHALAEDIWRRCGAIVKPGHAVDQAIDRELRGKFACVIVTELEAALATAALELKEFDGYGNPLAARFLRNYLAAQGQDIELTRKEALTFQIVAEAASENIERFKEHSIAGPEPGNPSHNRLMAFLSDRKAVPGVILEDYWKVDFNLKPWSGLGRELRSRAEDRRNAKAFSYGAGASHVTSEGRFQLIWQNDRVLAKGTITHTWTDEGYNFDKYQPFYLESQVLERHHKAKPFKWWATWKDEIEGELEVFERPLLEGLMAPRVLTWIRCKVSPAK